MLLKFLLSFYRAVNLADETISTKQALFMFRKTDVLQHSDIKRAFCLSPSAGGFVSKLRSVDNMRFYGESVSCQVSTDSSMDPVYLALLKNGSWWETEYEQHGCKYSVWCVLPQGFKPNHPHVAFEWKESSHKNMHELLTAEEEAGYGW